MLKRIFIAVLLLTGSSLASAQITQEFLDSLNEMTTADLAAKSEKSQKQAFEMFNELNDDPEFDVLCERVRETGTRMSVQKCEPRFVDEIRMMFASNPLSSSNESNSSSNQDQMAIAIEAYNFLDDLEGDYTENSVLSQAYTELTDRINTLREDNPEFHHVYTEYQAYTVVLSKR